jgi:hypothetical protein
MANSKQSKSLPWITSAPNPYKATHFAREESTGGQDSPAAKKKRQSRHGALPSEAWQISFDEHFKNYRNVCPLYPSWTLADNQAVHSRKQILDAPCLTRRDTASKRPVVYQRYQKKTDPQGVSRWISRRVVLTRNSEQDLSIPGNHGGSTTAARNCRG